MTERILDGQAVIEKRLRPRERTEPEAVARFESEAALLEILGGKVTPRFVGSGRDEEGPYLRIERLALATLAERLERSTPIAPGALAPIARTAYGSLADLHEAADDRGPLHVVHADLSPANVATDDAGTRVAFLDLELASWRQSLPRDGAFRGTVAYVAPEVARGELPSVGSDLFSLAATFLHALLGKPPRSGATFVAMLGEAAEKPIEDADLSRLIAAGPCLAALVPCLAFDPAKRPPSARAVFESMPRVC